jgi:hypothetical protein
MLEPVKTAPEQAKPLPVPPLPLAQAGEGPRPVARKWRRNPLKSPDSRPKMAPRAGGTRASADPGKLLARQPVDDAPAAEGGAHLDEAIGVVDRVTDDR